MIQAHNRLENILKEIPSRLSRISEEKSTHRTAPGKWSKKEELGHLIDSAANNHQRFVRLQIDNQIELQKYQQVEWVAVQRYHSVSWTEIVKLWHVYNTHLLHIMRHVDESKLGNEGTFPEYGTKTLQFLLDDYVDHLEHHLKTILL
jgi:hypothetical protein